jgi:Cu/Ag efflux pump CusA
VIDRIIDFSARNRFLVVLLAAAAALYAIDDIQRILAMAHDHNPRNRIAAARDRE